MKAMDDEEAQYSTDEELLYTVGEVARFYGISVRTLHHWERVGLVEPAERSWSNYRLYTEEDCSRIQQILIYRATGMKLAEIKNVLDSEESNAFHLRRQKERIMRQKQELDSMIAAIDTLLEVEMNGKKLSPEEIGQVLGDANFVEHHKEAEQLYGSTTDWQTSQATTATWNSDDWAKQKAEMDAIDAELAAAVRNAVDPHSDTAGELVEKHRAALGTFFPVTREKHYLISRGYLEDDRFRKYYENKQSGLAQWLADAIANNAARHGVDLDNAEWS